MDRGNSEDAAKFGFIRPSEAVRPRGGSRARYVLERGDWKAGGGSCRWGNRAKLSPTRTRITHFARGIGAARSGDAAAGVRPSYERLARFFAISSLRSEEQLLGGTRSRSSYLEAYLHGRRLQKVSDDEALKPHPTKLRTQRKAPAKN